MVSCGIVWYLAVSCGEMMFQSRDDYCLRGSHPFPLIELEAAHEESVEEKNKIDNFSFGLICKCRSNGGLVAPEVVNS